MKGSRIILPGELVGVIEEFIAGENVYERDGCLYSSVVGKLLPDLKSRKASVACIKPADFHIIRPTKKAVCRVVDERKSISIVQVLGIFSGNALKPLKYSKVGYLICRRTPSEEQLRRYPFKNGDYVEAFIINTFPSIILRLVKGKSGVILAFCSECSSPLVYKRRKLVCQSCGNVEYRRVSPNYLVKF